MWNNFSLVYVLLKKNSSMLIWIYAIGESIKKV